MQTLEKYLHHENPRLRLVAVGVLLFIGAVALALSSLVAWRVGLPVLVGKMILLGMVSVMFTGVAIWLVRILLVAPLESRLEQAGREVEIAEASAQAKMDFLSRMSHEIRTPLGAMMGFSQLLESANLNEDERKYLDSINLSGDFLIRILNDILDLSKIEASGIELEKASFNLSRFTETVVQMMNSEAVSKHITIESECVGLEGNNVIGDQHRLKQVLMNLIGNAIKFTDEGVVTLRIRSQILNDKASVCFEVLDTGIGMSPKQLNRIFKPFSQGSAAVSRKFGGTGLGLSISRQLVEMMGGELKAQSIKGKGSKFSFELEFDISEKTERRIKPKAALPIRRTGSPGRDLRILVAEDEAVNRTLISKFFSVLGYSLEFAVDGRECIEKLKSSIPYDAIFLDFHMPYFDGMEIAQRIKSGEFGEAIGEAKLTLMSADVLADDQAKKLGFDCFVAKPINIKELSACLDSIGTVEKSERTLKALIVEDQALNRQMIAQIFISLGMEASFANDGVECMEILEAHPDLDLILLDLRMPRMDGWTVARKIRNGDVGSDFSNIPIAVVSAEIQAEQSVRDLGVDEFIAKPFQVSQIRDFVLKVSKDSGVVLSR